MTIVYRIGVPVQEWEGNWIKSFCDRCRAHFKDHVFTGRGDEEKAHCPDPTSNRYVETIVPVRRIGYYRTKGQGGNLIAYVVRVQERYRARRRYAVASTMPLRMVPPGETAMG